MGITKGPCGYSTRLVGKTRFLGRPWAKVSRIGASGASGSATLPEPGTKARVRPRGCFTGAMWVYNRVGGYPGKTRFLERPWEKDSGGGSSSDYG